MSDLFVRKIVVMANSDEVQVMESELYEFLPTLEVSELETVFEKMQITCPEFAKGKKNVLLRLLQVYVPQMIIVPQMIKNTYC